MSYNGTCHCGQTTWTVNLDKEQSKHILWYATHLMTLSFPYADN